MQRRIDSNPFSPRIREAATRALGSLPDGRARNAAKARIVTPVDYMRCAEFPLVYSQMPLERGMKILDISSPQWFSLCLALEHPEVKICYVNILESELDQIRDVASALGLSNIEYGRQDVRSLRFDPQSFDRVVSISVIEHIAPEVGGDIKAFESISRVMKDSGTLTVSVPLKETRNVVYVDGSVYERSAEHHNFFAREYDCSQFTAAVTAAGLRIVEQSFISEKTGTGAVDFWQWGPGAESYYSRLFLSVLKVMRKVARISFDERLAYSYLRVSDEVVSRTANVVATMTKGGICP